MRERVKTGIPGLDEILNGGFIESDLVLLTGASGTGKTILACQYLYNSIANFNCPGIYVSFEERPEDIKMNMMNFGWDFNKLEKERKLVFVKYDPLHLEDIYSLIENNIRAIGAKRAIIDSITGLGLNIKEPAELRANIFNIGRMLKRAGCTSIITSEVPSDSPNALSTFHVEEHVTDDVIVLYYVPRGSVFTRAITVWKMRGSPHSNKIHPFKITEKGIVIYPDEETKLNF